MVVSKVGWYLSSSSIVSSDSMNSRLLDGKSVLGIFVTLVLLKMLSDVQSLLDQMIKILWDFSSKSFFSKKSLNFLSTQESHLRDTIAVSQDDTDLALGMTLFGELNNELFDILGVQFNIG